MNVRRWLAATCCVPLLALAACSEDEPSAEPDDPASTSSSPSPSPLETGPTIPPAAQGTDEASAKAFVRHYFDVLNTSMGDGDTDDLRALGKPSCESCGAFADNIDAAYEGGGRVDAEGWDPQVITRATKRQDMVLVVRVRQGKERFYSPDGELTRRFDGGSRNLSFYLANAHGDWLIWRLDLLA